MNLFDLFFPKKRKIYKKRYSVLQNKDEIEKLRKEAKEYLPKRLDDLANQHGFKYNNLRIKNVRSIWGSCSIKNNINLNLNLMKLDKKLIDYVILHELCHTIEKNHSQKFWNLLEEHLPDAKKLRRELRKTQLN
ncbi:MAG: M48 family metallopeptidase [Cyanobacteria bacterium SIG30]|nr:M48 family metallopeptidase [Cyanobacteria bacterium SIG30]